MVKTRLNGFDFKLTEFSFEKFVERMLGLFEQVYDFVKSAETVESLSNGSRIKFELE